MKKLIVFLVFVFAGLQTAVAQERTENSSEIRDQQRAIIQEMREAALLNAPTRKGDAAPMSGPAGVGEPDSFGKNTKFMGTAATGIIRIHATCDPAVIGTLGPDDRCIVAADPNLVTPGITFNDLGRITIPARSIDNVLYAIANHNVFISFRNISGSNGQGRVSYSPQVTIESEALNDPTLIDPTKDPPAPFDGSFTTEGMGSLALSKFLEHGTSEFQTSSYSRANTNGFSRTFFTALGLPSSVIDQIYRKPMTIKLNVRVSGRFVSDAAITYSIRFLGN